MELFSCVGVKLFILSFSSVISLIDGQIPVVISTWSFDQANIAAFKVLQNKGSALDAVQIGCSTCEEKQCDHTVGFGGSPDENGETTLDAMIMDGETMNMGAVGGLRRVKAAAAVARMVLDYTEHSLLVGDLATKFAVDFGFTEEPLYSNFSNTMQNDWKTNNCQPNFWVNVTPDPKATCGPYSPKPISKVNSIERQADISAVNHDTIGIAAVDSSGRIAAATSSNGAAHKIPGRVGDAPIPGAGCYADSTVGAASATGDGDVMMRFLPSFLAVEEMRRGVLPEVAAETAISRISSRYPDFKGALVTLRKDGKYGAACHGLPNFPYIVSNPQYGTRGFVASCS